MISWSRSSNCTLLELKQSRNDAYMLHGLSSNCTLLELKRLMALDFGGDYLVLIVPYWN